MHNKKQINIRNACYGSALCKFIETEKCVGLSSFL